MNSKLKVLWEKLFWSLISVKLWLFLVLIGISVYFVLEEFLTGDTWATFVVSVYGIYVGIREYSKYQYTNNTPTNKEEGD
jgi:hypothetical protein